jgi:hypothetical protein
LGNNIQKLGYNSVGYPENISLQLDGGFNTKLFGKDLGVIAVLNYSNNKRRTETPTVSLPSTERKLIPTSIISQKNTKMTLFWEVY